MPLLVSRLPDVPPEGYGCTFESPKGREVTSLSLTPNGCYLFVGFIDGAVRLYALVLEPIGGAARSGTLVGRIMPKGMNNSLKMNVATSEDCRFCFAGVLRGSTELMAVDLTRLPNWERRPTREEVSALGAPLDLKPLLRVNRRSDAKLKGFGAATRVRGTDGAVTEYRLFCGRGIKNIHIWSFLPLANGPNGDPVWQCLYDTMTNGMTVELVAFRKGGLEGVSKSDAQLLRVWDLTSPDKKPQCRDISNSRDTTCAFGDFAYGGLYQLSMVRINADEWANRTELALPPPADGDGGGGGSTPGGSNSGLGSGAASPGLPGGRTASWAGAQRRRHCRVIKSVTGTADGRHVLLVCSDGQVLYHRHTEAITGSFLPLNDLLGDSDEDLVCVTVGLVGGTGLPVAAAAGSSGRLEVRALPRTSAQEEEDVEMLGTAADGPPAEAFSWQESEVGAGEVAWKAVRPGEDDESDESSDSSSDELEDVKLRIDAKMATAAAAASAAAQHGAAGGGGNRGRGRWSVTTDSSSDEAEMDEDEDDHRKVKHEERERQNSGGSNASGKPAGAKKRRRTNSDLQVIAAAARSGRDSPARRSPGASSPAKRSPSGSRKQQQQQQTSQLGKSKKSELSLLAAADAEGVAAAASGAKRGRKRLREVANNESLADALNAVALGSVVTAAAGTAGGGSSSTARDKDAEAVTERAPGHDAAVKRPRGESGVLDSSEAAPAINGRESLAGSSMDTAAAASAGSAADAHASPGKGGGGGKGKNRSRGPEGNARKDSSAGAEAVGGKLDRTPSDGNKDRARARSSVGEEENAKPERRKPGRQPGWSRKAAERQTDKHERSPDAAERGHSGGGAGAGAAAAAADGHVTGGKRGRRAASLTAHGVAIMLHSDSRKMPAELPWHLTNFLSERQRRRLLEMSRPAREAASGGKSWKSSAVKPPLEAAAIEPAAESAAKAAVEAPSPAADPEVQQLLDAQAKERAALERQFRFEQERLRRGILAAIDRVKLAKEVESAGIEVQHGCATLTAAGWRLRERPDRSQVPLESLNRRGGAMTRGDARDLAAGLAKAPGSAPGEATAASAAVANGWNILQVEEDSAKRIESVIAEYRDALEDMLKVQRMQAAALAAMHAASLPPGSAAAVPKVDVPFRYNELLCQSRW